MKKGILYIKSTLLTFGILYIYGSAPRLELFHQLGISSSLDTAFGETPTNLGTGSSPPDFVAVPNMNNARSSNNSLDGSIGIHSIDFTATHYGHQNQNLGGWGGY